MFKKKKTAVRSHEILLIIQRCAWKNIVSDESIKSRFLENSDLIPVTLDPKSIPSIRFHRNKNRVRHPVPTTISIVYEK